MPQHKCIEHQIQEPGLCDRIIHGCVFRSKNNQTNEMVYCEKYGGYSNAQNQLEGSISTMWALFCTLVYQLLMCTRAVKCGNHESCDEVMT